ncbi:MAG: aminotransferase-like domain-containing protein, partial [Vulcanimicrobiaceae bacterium]
FQRTLLDDPAEAMQYRSSTGDPDLCAVLAGLLRSRGCNAEAGDIIVCSGAQQAADLVATVLLDERSVLASESPAYSGTLGVFDARGVTYVEVRSDEDGVRLDDVERVFAEYRPRLLYVSPIAQNPTGAILSQRRAKHIVGLARRYDVMLLEDQTGWQLTYDASPPHPLAAFDTDGRVIVMESLSKSIFPALRIGYLYAKGAIAEALEVAKVRADVFTSTLTQRALWRFMNAPAYPRHLRASRALYRNRRDAFVDALAQELPWSGVRPPHAGVNVWLPLPARISTQAAFDACAREGVLVMPAEPFYPTRSGPPALRLSFGHLTEPVAAEGLARLGRALRKLEGD